MSAQVTPMMAQFLEIKEEYPSALLFYRMGDFYEMFFDDAVAASQALDIALTKRGKHNGEDIPMCGVPVHAAEGYLLNLIRKGFRVAVCEQLESPQEAKKRGYKSVVKRGVVRLVTPGTLTEDSLLQPRQSNFLAAFSVVRGESCLAWADISTGEIRYSGSSILRLGPDLARLQPSEVLIPAIIETDVSEIILESGAAVTPVFDNVFDSEMGQDRLCTAYGVTSMEGFGTFSRPEIGALGGLIEYLTETQKGQLPLLRRPLKEERAELVSIDAATRRNLEITETLSGEKKGSLLATIDATVTAPGARLLNRRLSSPSQDINLINERLDAVSFFVENANTRDDVRDTLRKAPDLERALGRIAMGRGGPRDLLAICAGLDHGSRIQGFVSDLSLPSVIRNALTDLKNHGGLIDGLHQAVSDDPPLVANQGGFVRAGYSSELDEVRTLRDEARTVIASMQADFISLSGVQSLKIKHNNVLGYFIETPATHAEKMLAAPLNETFIHRQTTANAVRFTTVDLGELETKIINAAAKAIGLELAIFEDLKQLVLDHASSVQSAAVALANLDLAAACADKAGTQNWSRPEVTNSRVLDITGGRHPVVEAALNQTAHTFIANDCRLGTDADQIWLLTGPNMAGKSTFLRQNALIALMAQAGFFVPAKQAKIGVVSQIFSRVGASDDLARGRSTFMVEMVETAAILNMADDRALVILDEIGRGTSTYDGLAIAWATLEHLHEVNKCRALFATHYHELTQLSDRLTGVDNATVTVREWEGEVVFLHEVKKGVADRSYGVQVAKLAGLPEAVLNRANVVLAALEKGESDTNKGKKAIVDDLPLFSSSPIAPAPKISEVDEILSGIQPDTLSPRDALDLIYEMKKKSS